MPAEEVRLRPALGSRADTQCPPSHVPLLLAVRSALLHAGGGRSTDAVWPVEAPPGEDRSSGARPQAPPEGSRIMPDKDELKGKAREAGGTVQEKAGQVTGDRKMEAEGNERKNEGKVEGAWGKAKDAAGD